MAAVVLSSNRREPTWVLPLQDGLLCIGRRLVRPSRVAARDDKGGRYDLGGGSRRAPVTRVLDLRDGFPLIVDWQIGSGPTESQCRPTVERLKHSGQRWDRRNAEAVAALGSLDRSGQWQSYWRTPSPVTS